MFSKNKTIIAVVVLLIAIILGSQTFLPTGFFNDSNRVFATIYGTKTVPVTGIALSKTTLNMKIKDKVKLAATLKPSNSTRKTPSWFSSNKKVATVAKDGTITAVGNGTAVITAFTETQFADCKVTVSTAAPTPKPVSVTGVAIDKTLTLKLKATKQLVAAIKPTNATNKALTWTSSNALVAVVDANGKVTAKKVGTAKITVKTKDGGKTSICTVTVKK